MNEQDLIWSSKKYQHVDYIATVDGCSWACTLGCDNGLLPTLCSSEREAAVLVDKILIKRGLDPVNILKKKVNG